MMLGSRQGGRLTLVHGHAESSICSGREMIHLIARKNYSDEFRRQAVD